MSFGRNLRGINGNGYATSELPVPSPAGGVSIQHPAYQEDGLSNPILWLPSLDLTLESGSTQFGFHCGTLMSICYIITGNRPGFLSPRLISSDNGQELATMPDSMPAFDSILTEETYYYYIHGARLDEQYKVLSQFSEWQFPDAEALGRYEYWAKWLEVFHASSVANDVMVTSEISEAIHTRDKKCRLTGAPANCGCDVAYIVPKEDGDWFKDNDMWIYSKGLLRGTADPTALESNMCLLRCDILWMFEEAYFAFVPKQNHLVVHFFDSIALEAGRFIHNCSLDGPGDFSAEYFFARLAWTVLPLTCRFTGEFPKLPGRKRSLTASDDNGRNTRSKLNPDASTSSGVSGQDSEMAQPTGLIGQTNSAVDEERELAEENALAIRCHPYLFGPNALDGGSDDDLALPQSTKDERSAQRAHARSLYDTLGWYPGLARTERLKKAYMDANPQIGATCEDGDAASISSGEI
ncbi:hypothetical protein BDV93DRAFT_547518 [Ceratobasidium sp. AG-I]|nr:hypothetical protein BDV93DRAFT_547518 [Ceratobasidium sp. AG-I]